MFEQLLLSYRFLHTSIDATLPTKRLVQTPRASSEWSSKQSLHTLRATLLFSSDTAFSNSRLEFCYSS